MGWADRAVATLREDKDAVIYPKGNSMRPKIISGARIVLEPITIDELKVGDIVLCRVSGRVYLHLVKAKQNGRVLIANNRGGVNGWTAAVYGRAKEIKNP